MTRELRHLESEFSFVSVDKIDEKMKVGEDLRHLGRRLLELADEFVPQIGSPEWKKILAQNSNFVVIKAQIELASSKRAENTHLLCNGKYRYQADLLFDWFGFDQTCKYLIQHLNQKGEQPYSDTCPYKVSECSLKRVLNA